MITSYKPFEEIKKDLEENDFEIISFSDGKLTIKKSEIKIELSMDTFLYLSDYIDVVAQLDHMIAEKNIISIYKDIVEHFYY